MRWTSPIVASVGAQRNAPYIVPTSAAAVANPSHFSVRIVFTLSCLPAFATEVSARTDFYCLSRKAPVQLLHLGQVRRLIRTPVSHFALFQNEEPLGQL